MKGSTKSPEARYAQDLLQRALAALKAFESCDQAWVDRIVNAVFRAAFDARIRLAEAAVGETGIGRREDKAVKNAMAALAVYRHVAGKRTVGVLKRDEIRGVVELARPLGPVVALTPVTNPTATVINDAIICLKARNPVIFCPHKAAKRCSRLAAEICYEAARSAGAPDGCIQWTTKSRWPYTEALMAHEHTALVLATTAFHFVKEAYRCGHPVLGSGEGNVPVYVDDGADAGFTARSILTSKCFDNGTVCCSEQILVVPRAMDAKLRRAFTEIGGYFLSVREKALLERSAFDRERRIMRSEVVGRSAVEIAGTAGFPVPGTTRLLIVPVTSVGPEEALSHEILAPILAYRVVAGFEEAEQACRGANAFHGRGHTLCIYAADEARGEELGVYFGERLDAGRILVNTPASLGGLGGTLNGIPPSLTLSCGTRGGNYLTANISVEHLLNVNRVAFPRPDAVWSSVAPERWWDANFRARDVEAMGDP